MNLTKKFFMSLGRGTRVALLSLAVVFVSAGIAQAATTISTDIVTAGSATLGDTVADVITANGYFTQVRVGTGSTFDDISSVGADELGVEGAMEVDGAAYFDGAVDLDSTLNVAGASIVQELTQGGGQCTITDANGGAYVLTQAELSACNYLYMTASGAGQEVIALTLPATSTMTTLLANVGDTREWLIDASDLAAATTTTITAGTGIDMLAVTTAEDVIDGGEYSELRCWRKSDTDVACITSELVNAD